MRQRKKVLVVDGNESNINLIRELLAKEKFEVINAGGAEEALDIAESQDIQLIISELPEERQANRFIRQLRERAATGEVIFVSKQSDEVEWLEAINIGASDLISEPFTKDKILKSINKALHGSHIPSFDPNP